MGEKPYTGMNGIKYDSVENSNAIYKIAQINRPELDLMLYV